MFTKILFLKGISDYEIKRHLDNRINIKFLTKTFWGKEWNCNQGKVNRCLVYLYSSILFEVL